MAKYLMKTSIFSLSLNSQAVIKIQLKSDTYTSMVKPTNTLKATTLKSTSIQLPKLTNRVH